MLCSSDPIWLAINLRYLYFNFREHRDWCRPNETDRDFWAKRFCQHSFHRTENCGSPREILVPFQNCPVFSCSNSFSLFVPCFTCASHYQHQHLVVPAFPTTVACSLVPYIFPLFPKTLGDAQNSPTKSSTEGLSSGSSGIALSCERVITKILGSSTSKCNLNSRWFFGRTQGAS